MAQRLGEWLASESYPAILLYNRTASKLPAESATTKHAKSPEDLAERCDVVFTSLANDEAATTVYERLLEGAKKRSEQGKKTTFVETSTLYPTCSGELERRAAAIDRVRFLQCPVFGPPPLAAEGKLVFVLSGDYGAKKFITPLLVPSMGRKTIDVGANVERAAAFKLNGNMMILALIETLGEALTLADRTGVGADLMMEFVQEVRLLPFSSSCAALCLMAVLRYHSSCQSHPRSATARRWSTTILRELQASLSKED